MEQEKKPRGRPRKSDADKFKQRMVRMPDGDYDHIVRKAERAGVTFSEYVRTKAMEAR